MAAHSHPIRFWYQSKARMQLPISHHSNLGPILPRFRDIAGFLLRTAIPLLFHPNFGGVSLAGIEAARSEDLKLINRIIKFRSI